MTNSFKISSTGISPKPYTTDDTTSLITNSFPGSKIVSVTPGSSGSQYKAPANGYFTCVINMTGSYSNMQWYLNGNIIYADFAAGVVSLGGTVAVKKGDTIQFNYSVQSGTPTINRLCFTYSAGESS